MNKKIKVFTKKDCPNCPPAKKLGEEIAKENLLEVEFYNVDQSEGLAEAQFYSVMATPTIVLCDANSDETELKSWRGETPEIEEIKEEVGEDK